MPYDGKALFACLEQFGPSPPGEGAVASSTCGDSSVTLANVNFFFIFCLRVQADVLNTGWNTQDYYSPV